MTRTVSQQFRDAALGQGTGEAFILLVELDEPSLTDTIRVSSDNVDTSHGGQTYTALPFDVDLPNDTEEGPPTARLRIDNISREIVRAVRTASSAITVRLKLVLSSDPETVEAGFPDFQLRGVQYDALVVEGNLRIESFDQAPYPEGRFDAARFPGLF